MTEIIASEHSLLVVDTLSYQYGLNPALKNVSFELDAGELAVLIGRNGAGKSTLLRCIAGWTQATKGNIVLKGRSISQHERWLRQHVALIPDTPPFYEELTAWEHLQMIAQLHRLVDWEEKAAKLLASFGLWSNRESFPFMFSRGMRYKLALCLALLLKPSLLLLDEPLGPLDPLSADFLWGELIRYQEQGMGILLSSHQMPQGIQPERYLIMEQGQLVLQGTPNELMAASSPDGDISLEALLETAVASFIDTITSDD
ncbi:MAG: ABC transporter ATP-binding protein [Ardenticatenaceae bacterium]|nr:ABC transporter ATP-binding protein [Ardenticatenaceae bacterium]MCB9444449.1 ABC transporter ATP-binding protein [Ardenticatenaceae bacterium]